MFQGSLLDSDFQGMSTMDMLNLTDIDVMSIGNHELDYGISHMMFASRYMVNTYQMDIDEKYGTIITRLKRGLDNYGRGNTTEVGQLFVDAFSDSLDVDIMMMASSNFHSRDSLSPMTRCSTSVFRNSISSILKPFSTRPTKN